MRNGITTFEPNDLTAAFSAQRKDDGANPFYQEFEFASGNTLSIKRDFLIDIGLGAIIKNASTNRDDLIQNLIAGSEMASLTMHLSDPHLKLRACLQSRNDEEGDMRYTVTMFRDGNREIQHLDFEIFRWGAPEQINISRWHEDDEFEWSWASWSDDRPKDFDNLKIQSKSELFAAVKEAYKKFFANMLSGKLPDFRELENITEFELYRPEEITSFDARPTQDLKIAGPKLV